MLELPVTLWRPAHLAWTVYLRGTLLGGGSRLSHTPAWLARPRAQAPRRGAARPLGGGNDGDGRPDPALVFGPARGHWLPEGVCLALRRGPTLRASPRPHRPALRRSAR